MEIRRLRSSRQIQSVFFDFFLNKKQTENINQTIIFNCILISLWLFIITFTIKCISLILRQKSKQDMATGPGHIGYVHKILSGNSGGIFCPSPRDISGTIIFIKDSFSERERETSRLT